MTPKKDIKAFGIDDAKHLVTETSIAIGSDILVFDDFRLLEITGDHLRLGFLAYCYCQEGCATFNLNSRSLEMKRGDLFIGVGQQVINIESISPDFKAVFVFVSQKFMLDSLSGLHQLWSYLIYLYDHPMVPLTEEEGNWVLTSFKYIKRRLTYTTHPYLRESIASLIRLFYFDICALLSLHVTSDNSKHIAGYGIFDRFIHLLATECTKERNLSWYSDQLCLTPKYLSEVVKSVSGQTAGQWVTHFVIMEAKQLLSRSSLSIKEIAQHLNFANQSFFGKYFKNITGVSPLEYRKMN